MSALESPDLAPELVESLLRSLKSWDPRASVPLALDYMEYGDPDALNGFDAMARQNPAAEQMLEDRYLSPSPDVDALRNLPEETLGQSFARYLDDNQLDANLLRESAFIPAHRARGEEVGYLAERGFQLHDLFHVLTGFDTTPLGEVRVISFTVAQTPAPYPAMILASRPLQMVLYRPELLPPVMDAITEGWALGRRARCLLAVRWEDYWGKSLEELREEFELL